MLSVLLACPLQTLKEQPLSKAVRHTKGVCFVTVLSLTVLPRYLRAISAEDFNALPKLLILTQFVPD